MAVARFGRPTEVSLRRTLRRWGHIGQRKLHRRVGPTQVARITLVTSVDHTGEDWPHCAASGGGADRSALRKAGTRRVARGIQFLVWFWYARLACPIEAPDRSASGIDGGYRTRAQPAWGRNLGAGPARRGLAWR